MVEYLRESSFPYVALKNDDLELFPVRADHGSVGYDLKANEDFELFPSQTLVIGTGVYPFFTDGEYALIYSRSGLAAKKSIFVLNSPGLIDTSYRGEICVILHRLDVKTGMEPVVFKRGDRIAQMVIQPYPQKRLTHLSMEQFNKAVESERGNARGTGGFGSTGV